MFRPIFPSPHHHFKRWCGVAVCGVFLLAGCAAPPASPPVATKKLVVKNPNPKLENPFSQAVVKRWLQNATASQVKNLQPTSPQKPPAVYMNLDVLARRHPAWQLADALQNGAALPAAPKVSAPQTVGANLSSSSSRNNAPALPSPIPDRALVLPASQISSSAPKRSLRAEQEAALANFLAATQSRRDADVRSLTNLQINALEDEAEVAARRAVPELDPLLPAERTQLELINLRLQLLRNIPKTPEEEAAANARLDELEARWQRQLHEQAQNRAAAIENATITIPARLKLEGATRLAAQNATQSAQRRAAREELDARQNELLNRDFGADDLRLSLQLPSAQTVAAPQNASAIGVNRNFSKTSGGVSPSNRALPRTGAAPAIFAGQRSAQSRTILALRAQARTEAARWAQLAAAQEGWIWQNNPALPDQTARALDILFPN